MLEDLQVEKDAPWKGRFRAPAITVSRIAPSAPARGILASTRSGTLQWYAWDVPAGQLKQITNTPGGHHSLLALSPDGRWVYYLDGRLGFDIGHYVRMPAGGGRPKDITPRLPLYTSYGFAISRSAGRIGLLASFQGQVHLFCLDLAGGGKPVNLRKLYSSTRLLRGVLLSYGGEFVTVSASERAGKPGSGLLAFDTRSGEKISELWDGQQNSLEMMVPSPLPGDPRLLASTTRTGIETLLIWNPYSGEQIDLNLGDVTGALRAFDWSPDGSSILFRTFNAAVQQLYIHNLHTGVTIPLGRPDGANIEPYFTPAGDEIFSHWQSSTCPPRLIALSARTGETTRTVISAGDAPPGRAWTSIMFPSLDGQQVQGWLGLPEGAGPFPAVIEAHGGPFEVQGEAFSPGAQAWLDHGFAYLSVNYRGSTTFGREFERKIYGLPGAWEIEDLVAARRWLVERDIARPDSVLLTGWSYGGFLTLLALGRTPDLWAGGMARAAIADWNLLYDDSAEPLRGYLVSLFGGMPKQVPALYRASSPVTYVEEVEAPVLIIQSRKDTITPPGSVEIYHIIMEALGKDIQVDWVSSGHTGSFTSAEEGIRQQELMLRFAYRVLGSGGLNTGR